MNECFILDINNLKKINSNEKRVSTAKTKKKVKYNRD